MPNIIRINDISAPEIAPYLDLKGSKLKNEQDVFIVESVKVIKTAIECGLCPKSFLMEERQIEGIGKELIKSFPDVPVYASQREILSHLTGFELTRGVLAAFNRPKKQDITEILKTAKKIAVLERLSDSVNVGAIFRSAAALGLDAVLLFNNCSEPLNRRSVRVSMGTVFQIPWAFFEGNETAVEVLKQNGFKTAALALKDDTLPINDSMIKKAEKIALLLGSEGEGLNEEVINSCDYTVKIPMHHGVDSLNVAACAAIAFWEISQK